jgi:exodeoxyribonuclease VII small subunit
MAKRVKMCKKPKERALLEVKDIQSLEKIKTMEVPFEEAYTTLEKIVALQEDGDISLEDSVMYYKAGKILAKYCVELLENAKVDVQKIADES